MINPGDLVELSDYVSKSYNYAVIYESKIDYIEHVDGRTGSTSTAPTKTVNWRAKARLYSHSCLFDFLDLKENELTPFYGVCITLEKDLAFILAGCRSGWIYTKFLQLAESTNEKERK